jgi:DNA anti-recombination protein RmuC
MTQEIVVGVIVAFFSAGLGATATAWKMNATLTHALHKVRNEMTIQLSKIEAKVNELDRHGSGGLEKMQGRLEQELEQMEKRIEHMDEVGSRSMGEMGATLNARLEEHMKQPGHEGSIVKLAQIEVKVDRLIKDVENLARTVRNGKGISGASNG